MSEKLDANGNPMPAGSSSANNGNGENGKPLQGANNPANVPFHEDPQIQEYISRQVEKKIQEAVQNNAGHSNNIPNQEDELVNEFSKDLGLDKNQAKLLVEKFKKVHDTMNGGTKLAIQEMNYRNRLIELGTKYSDSVEIQKEMYETFQKMTPLGKEYVLKDPDGLESLYHKTKSIKGHYANSTFRNAGGSSKSSASNMNRNDDSVSTLTEQAALAASSGDRKTYEETVKKLYQSGGFKK